LNSYNPYFTYTCIDLCRCNEVFDNTVEDVVGIVDRGAVVFLKMNHKDSLEASDYDRGGRGKTNKRKGGRKNMWMWNLWY
jgi:hypothetical protein